jgi:hypothetical protein
MACLGHDYQIAVGFDNTAGLTPVTSITDGSTNFYEPSALGSFSNGRGGIASDGGLFFDGFKTLVWNMTMTTKQYVYWRTTYAGGGYSGNVTIRTTTEQSDTYANYNAVMLVPQVNETERQGDYYTIAIRMTRLVLIPPPPP